MPTISEKGLERYLDGAARIEEFYGTLSADNRGFYLRGERYEYRIKTGDNIIFIGEPRVMPYKIELTVSNRKIRRVK